MRSAGVKKSRRWTAALLLGFIPGGWSLHGQAAKPTEYQVKAAYLANFVKFVEWPAGAAASADEPFVICVLGQDPFGAALDAALAGESVDRHPLTPRRIANAREAAGCRVLFIAGDDKQIKTTLAALEKSGILTVSDFPQFLKRGGIIQFVPEGKRDRFEVYLEAAKNAGLNLSSGTVESGCGCQEDSLSGAMLSTRSSITRKLTWINTLASGVALLVASVAFVSYELSAFRQSMVRALSVQAQIVGFNSASALLFSDPEASRKTLSALEAAPNIISAEIYLPTGEPFAMYVRDASGRASYRAGTYRGTN